MTNLTQPPAALIELIERPLDARSRIIAAFLYDCDPDGFDCKDPVQWLIDTHAETVRQLEAAHANLRELGPLLQRGMHPADAKSISALVEERAELIAALREIKTICTESAAACRKRMGTRVGNVLVVARAAIKKAKGE